MSESKTPIEPIDVLVERDLSGWAQFIWNCTDGSNYFRYSEYCDLIRTLDSYAADLAAAQELIRTREMGMQDTIALHAKQAAALTAERDALAARVEQAEADARRYRWLRDESLWHCAHTPTASGADGRGIKVTFEHHGSGRFHPTVTLCGDLLDETIDAQLKECGDA